MCQKVLLLLLLALASFSYAQQLLSNPHSVYKNPTDGTVIKAIAAASTTCSATLIIMDNSSQCIKFADVNGVVYDWTCTPEQATAFDLFGFASAAYLINAEGHIVIIDMYTADTIDVIGVNQTKAVHPYKIGLYTSYAVITAGHTWFMADGATNSTIYLPSWTVATGNVNQYSSSLIVQLNNTQPIKCLFTPAGGIFMVVYEGGNTIFVYSWTAATASPAQKYLYNITGFGQIGACNGDYYNRGWIWDNDCNCLKVIVQQGSNNWVVQQSLSLPDVSNPKNIQATRNKVFIHDDNGVMRYDLPALGATYAPPSNPTCASTATSLHINATWGSPPYTARVLPDQVSSTSSNIIPSFTYNYTGSVKYKAPYAQVFHLYDDVIAAEYQAIATSGLGSPSTPASVFTPFDGINSWSMLMAHGYQYGITVSTTTPGATISSTFFQTLEMMVNPGDGLAGPFRIDMTSGTNYYYFDYTPSSLPANSWTKISIDLSMGPVTSWTKIVFADYSNSSSSTSFLYVDNIFLIPYNGTRVLAVKDFCNVTVFSTPYPIDGENLLAASVESQTTSCNPADAVGQSGKTNDGSLSAIVSGGVAPYKFSWNFTSETTSNLTGLSPLGTSDTIYENLVNPVFTDFSSGTYSLNDTTYFRSAPYSVSLVPAGITSDIIFFTPAGISASTYTAVEFWVYGGSQGNQLIYAGLVSNQFDLLNPSLIHRLMGIPSIPANVWTKVTYPISPSAGTFYGFVLRASAGITQPTIYFDDIRFTSSSLQGTVTDSANCAITNYVSVSSPLAISVVPQVSNLKCYGASGSVNLDVVGGTAPYSYSWNPAASTNSSASNLGESTYSVTVTDVKGCVTPTSTTVKVLQPSAINVATQVQTSKCAGTNGTVTARASGGVPPYSFAWSSPSGAQFAAQPLPAPLAIFTDSFHLQGSFKFNVGANVTVVCDGQSDAYAAQSGYCALLLVPPVASATLLSIGCPKCIDFSQYSAITFWVNFVGAANPPSLTAQFISNNAPIFTQDLNVTSTSGWQMVTVTLPTSGLADSFALVQNSANAGAFLIDTINLVPIGPLSQPTVSGGKTVTSGVESVIQGAAGQYIVLVTDSNGCSLQTTAQITVPSTMNVSFTCTPSTSSKNPNGAIAANVTGGVPPYTYYWPDVKLNGDAINGLSYGNYLLQLTDANGCTLNTTATLAGPPSVGPLSPAPLLSPSLFSLFSLFAVLVAFL